jgi:hypothetical protein
MNGWSFAPALVSIVLSMVVIPLILRVIRQNRETRLMVQKKLFENTGVRIYGEFDGQLQSEYLGSFLTTLFGERLFLLITSWNDKPSPSLIVPPEDFMTAHMLEVMAAHSSPFILQSNGLKRYFQNVEVHGTENYKYCKCVVALARPDASKLESHDYPRLVVVEAAALKRIHDNPNLQPQESTPEGRTWLETLKDMAGRYYADKRSGMAILEFPVDVAA